MLTPRQLSGVAEGLNYLHSFDVIHGDLHGVCDYLECYFPMALTHTQLNILVDATGRARITDFGLATITRRPDSAWSILGDQTHRVRWAAPEILNHQGTYSKEADVFSFAMVAIEVRGE